MFETQERTRNRTRDLPKKGSAFILSSDHWSNTPRSCEEHPIRAVAYVGKAAMSDTGCSFGDGKGERVSVQAACFSEEPCDVGEGIAETWRSGREGDNDACCACCAYVHPQLCGCMCVRFWYCCELDAHVQFMEQVHAPTQLHPRESHSAQRQAFRDTVPSSVHFQ